MSTDTKPLSEDLARLVRAERSALGAPPGAEARVLAKLERSLRGPGGGGGEGGRETAAGSAGASAVKRAGTAAGWTLRSAATTAGVFLVGVAVGVFGERARTPAPPAERIVYVERAAPPAPAASSAEAERMLAPEAVPSMSSPAPAPARTLAEERATLDVARAALIGGNGEAALQAVDRHQRRYPAGALTEEREALAVEALLALSRTDEARARAARFEKRFPRSVLLPTVQAAVRRAGE